MVIAFKLVVNLAIFNVYQWLYDSASHRVNSVRYSIHLTVKVSSMSLTLTLVRAIHVPDLLVAHFAYP